MGSVVSILAGAHGFDTDSVVSGTYAACVATNDSMKFAGRYIPLAGVSATGDLTSAEAVQLTENGLAVLVVQHPRGGSYASLTAAANQGTSDGNKAVSYLSGIVAPAGIFVYCDIEGFDNPINPGSYAVAWANAWATVVNASAYRAAYYGPENVLANTTVTWPGRWENLMCFGPALTGANISQGAEACNPTKGVNLTCGGTTMKIDHDTMLTGLGGFWGF
jgi:hypothetical protein